MSRKSKAEYIGEKRRDYACASAVKRPFKRKYSRNDNPLRL